MFHARDNECLVDDTGVHADEWYVKYWNRLVVWGRGDAIIFYAYFREHLMNAAALLLRLLCMEQ